MRSDAIGGRLFAKSHHHVISEGLSSPLFHCLNTECVVLYRVCSIRNPFYFAAFSTCNQLLQADIGDVVPNFLMFKSFMFIYPQTLSCILGSFEKVSFILPKGFK